ncbi:hypothetical protein CYMTET_19535 [Cymbomonas tetramitiformis]|uniref:Uncharacterized protein n=1 Tax=Cymbomonas tetramitiformis TaxID=36881 RepID=A0AAE0G778_9CHLO|nr:hypothetical protein CYMTET_30369 [Cymbomonas tetramitiformis]KAK3272151.1 hypothetical protein CYMTET_19535 [Cymbomonas tetramitiformis]
MDEKAAKRQLLAALDPEFYREVITPRWLDTELAVRWRSRRYSLTSWRCGGVPTPTECPLCPGHFHDTAQCPIIRKSERQKTNHLCCPTVGLEKNIFTLREYR